MRFPSTLRPSGKKCLGNRKFPSRLQSAMQIEVMCNFTRNSFDIHDCHILSLDSSQPMFVAVSVSVRCCLVPGRELRAQGADHGDEFGSLGAAHSEPGTG